MKFYGELLIFVLLFVTNIRVFFVDSAKRDPLAALAPLTFLLSILQILAWGVGMFTALGLIISFFVLLSNFHALFRYSERLYVDHYSPLMMVWAIFTSILSLAAIVALFIFAPKELNSRNLGITETSYKYTGEFRSGFDQTQKFQKVNATLYEYKLDNKKADEKLGGDREPQTLQQPIVLFVPDKRGDTYYYKPFLQLLAQKGFTVVSGDFYARDGKWFHSLLDLKILRRISMVTESMSDPYYFNSQREFYTYNIGLECKALLNIVREKYGPDCQIFVISDGMSNDAVNDLVKTKQKNVVGTFSLNTIAGYKTSGYGCIAQTAPLLNMVMGLERESKFETPELLAEETAAYILARLNWQTTPGAKVTELHSL